LGARAVETDVVAQVVTYERAHADGAAPASFRAADYRGDLHDLPIGVFDSGIGGLTVFEAIKNYDKHNNVTGADGADGVPDFANEKFIYLGDQANMPYGNYPSAGRLDFLRELVERDLLFLLGRNYGEVTPAGVVRHADKPPVKAIVIACNTATAVGLTDVRAALKAWDVPITVIGVIEAGAHATVQNGRAGSVAVFATVATCANEAYPRAILQAAVEKNLPPRSVYQQGFATLAAAIEGDASLHQTPDQIVRAEVKAFLARCQQSAPSAPIDTLVLGCTHFPLVISQFRAALAAESAAYPGLLAADVAIVDPAETTALELYQTLSARKLWATGNPAQSDRFFITVANPRAAGVALDAGGGLTAAYKYARSPGEPGREDTVVVPMRADTLPASGAALVRDHLPRTWAGLLSASAN
jgi:glutamate racemase